MALSLSTVTLKRIYISLTLKGEIEIICVTLVDRVVESDLTRSSALAVSRVTAKIYFIYILKFVHETRETSSLFVLLSNIGHPTP